MNAEHDRRQTRASSHRLLTAPNALSVFRIAVAPLQLVLAHQQYPRAFLALLVLSLLSDALDGFLARRSGTTSTLGARLDSWGDMTMFLTLPICVWWLWPAIIRREAAYVITAIACYLVPVTLGFLRFGRLTCYHAWTAKFSTILLGGTVPLLLLGGPAWPFRLLAIPVFVISAVEDIAITLTLKKWRPNVRSLWHALRRTDGPKP